jgi:hypothetical protein
MENATLYAENGGITRVVSNTLEDHQKFVCGYIELLPGTNNVLVNEEGAITGQTFNPTASEKFGRTLLGPVLELDSPLE